MTLDKHKKQKEDTLQLSVSMATSLTTSSLAPFHPLHPTPSRVCPMNSAWIIHGLSADDPQSILGESTQKSWAMCNLEDSEKLCKCSASMTKLSLLAKRCFFVFCVCAIFAIKSAKRLEAGGIRRNAYRMHKLPGWRRWIVWFVKKWIVLLKKMNDLVENI